jgi:hypothetical protein
MFKKALLRESRCIPVYFFFADSAASCDALAIRNLATFFAGTLLVSPDAAFRPACDFACTRTKRPTPGNTNSPVFSDRSANKERSLATFFDTPSFFAVFAALGKPVSTLTVPCAILSQAYHPFFVCLVVATNGVTERASCPAQA